MRTFFGIELDAAAREVARVLYPGGTLAFHNFGGRALILAQILGGLVRLRRPRLTTGFHTDAIHRWRDVEAALAAAGLRVTEVEGRVHVPGLTRLTDRCIRTRGPALLPWSWDVVVVSKKSQTPT